MTITNRYGVIIDFYTAVNLMDDDTREAIHATGDYDDNPQGFFDAYAAARYPDLREFAEMVLSTWPES